MSGYDAPGVAVHNSIYSRLMALAARYRTTVQIPGPFLEGTPGHVEVHNANGRAMIHLRDVANGYHVVPPVVIALPDVANVGDDGHIADHVLHDEALDVLDAVTLPWE